MWCFLTLFLLLRPSLGFVATPARARQEATPIQLAVTTTSIVVSTTSLQAVPTSSRAAPDDLVFSPVITLAPLSANPLDRRQKCFNDQGFSVDCATWTGYYYTWGPPGNPYEGGPWTGGSDSGSGNGNGNGGGSGLTAVVSGASLRCLSSAKPKYFALFTAWAIAMVWH